MCGICGIFNLDDRSVDYAVLGRMLNRIRHRGPDESGMYLTRQIGLGHARLSIIDLSGGRQPMHNEDQSLWISFNGEIFNYIELREDLIRKGRRFVTQSDTEVILQLYEEEGEKCVTRLNGQWAFAIWDGRKEKLFLSRDRLGVRPLFYTKVAEQSFLFASEIKSILTHPDVPRELDSSALNQIFTFWHTLPPNTAFKGIFELPPGHSLTMTKRNIKVEPYWQLRLSDESVSSNHVAEREQEYLERLRELLIDATRVRLRADVPVGAYLSGGLDSSLITAIVRKFTNKSLSTFSIAFDDVEYDESCYQRQVVSHLETNHQEIRCTHDDIGRVFPDVVWHAEKPLLRTAAAPMYLLSKFVRENGFKVVLTGEGSDEIFGGYDIFKETKIRSFWGAQPNSKLRPLLLRRLYPYMQDLQNQPEAYLKMFFRVRSEDLNSLFFSHLPRWEMTAKLGLFFSDAIKAELNGYQPYRELEKQLPPAYQNLDSFRRAQYLESAYLLPGYILSSQGDRVAMAHAVEGRFPFLDYRVVEFASSLPPGLKMRGLEEKYL
jgi:asparagine synthase (glutamine-hydrolysing)